MDESSSSSYLSPSSTSPIPSFPHALVPSLSTGSPFLSTIFAPSSPVVSVMPSIPIPSFPPTSSSLPTTLASSVFSHLVFSVTNIRNYVAETLDHTNFFVWKELMIPILKSKGVYGHVDGSDSCPSPNSPDFDYLMQVDYQLIAKLAWESIHQLYQSQLSATALQLTQEFSVSDKDLVLRTIAGLDHFFSVAKRTIPQRVPFPTFLELRSLLLIEEANILFIMLLICNEVVVLAGIILLGEAGLIEVGDLAEVVVLSGIIAQIFLAILILVAASAISTRALPPLLPTSPTSPTPPTLIACQWCNRLGHQACDCSFLTTKPASASSTPQSLYANLVPAPMDPNWYFDSGAQTHATNNPGKLLRSTPSSSSNFIQVGNGQLLPVTSRGDALLSTSNSQFSLNNVLVAPHLTKNLVFVRQFTRDNNCSVNFDSSGFSIKDNKMKNVLLRCNSSDGLYSFSSGSFPNYPAVYSVLHSLDVWHCHLGHPSITSIQHLARHGLLPIERVTLPPRLCHACYIFLLLMRSQVGTRKPRVLPSLLATETDIREPKTFKEACQFSEWHSAMVDEFSALLKNNTWSLVPHPSTVNVVGSKWVYRIKQKANGSIERFKARLVAQGFTQQQGIDYDDTFSHMVKPVTIRTVLALTVMYSWPIHQLDVKNAFLHGRLSEVVYMSQPPGFIDPKYPDYVCRLNCALYGLKQAPRAWFQRFASFLFTRGFSQARSDSSMFLYHSNGAMAILLLYVDDIVLTASTKLLLHAIISLLKSEFLMTDLGQLNYFLGISVSFNSDGLFLSQSKYTHELLERSGMLDCKLVVTPMAPKAKLFSIDSPAYSDPAFYRSIVGALQYLNLYTPKYCFCCWPDVDWVGCVATRRSISGYCLFLGNSLISWSSKKQNTVTRSSAEAEYRAIANAVAKVLWVRQLLSELHVFLHSPLMVYCDNISAIYLSLNLVQHQQTKHIEIDIHFVRERVASGIICIQYVPSSAQRADVLTKALSSALF
ncbi:hypothetical protein SLEP1_g29696 [Rubroshorea leprosula]|uniref:Reverse transcriptase Ty1/copia-type domain-containing protein n=1 Tax=Rubroshorea leprosula TaxID=152421 RepID=A0AAV5K913_9ROSI|nr:hypothetical protein SLEP1_g29696 [Rubroshorea leprosula]